MKRFVLLVGIAVAVIALFVANESKSQSTNENEVYFLTKSQYK